MAQLGARYHGTVEVVGSNPIDSTSGSIKLPLLFIFLLFLSLAFAEWRVVFDEEILSTALSMIKSARWEVLMVSFGVDHPEVIEALKMAKRRNVDVCVVTDDRALCSLEHLVDAEPDSLMHEKWLLVDRREVLVSTANFTHRGLKEDRNVALVMDEEGIVDALLEEFINFSKGFFSSEKTPVVRSGKNWKIFFAPGYDPLLEIVRVFEKARWRILLCGYSFTDPQMTLLLKLLASRGLDVRLMLDAHWCERYAHEELSILRSGLKVRTFDGEGILHAKFVVVDGRWLILGSANFTRSARFRNDEVVVILEDEKVAAKVEKWFMEIWEKTR